MNKYTTSLTPAALAEEVEKIKNEDISKYPSVFQMGRNLLKESWIAAVSLSKGQSLLTTPEKAAARLAICEGCKFFDKDQGRCIKCGCFMRAKANLETSTCPMSLWGDLQNTKSSVELPAGATNFIERNVNIPYSSEIPNIKNDIIKGLKSFSPDEIKLFSEKYDEVTIGLSENKTFKVKNITFTVLSLPIFDKNKSKNTNVSGSSI